MSPIKTKPETGSRIATVLPFRTLSQFCVESARSVNAPVLLALLLIAPATYAEDTSEEESLNSDTGMINRAPFVSTKIKPSNLDRISTDISDITESLSNILTSSDKEEEEFITEAEPVEAEIPAPVIAEPEKITPKKIEIAKPAIIEPSPVIPKQEPAESQPEIIANDGASKTEELLKIKYMKKNSDGSLLPDDATNWSCVEDVHNNLIWEVKSDDGGIHDKDNSYSWFHPDEAGAPQGMADGGKCKGEADCDTYAYIEQLNKQNYCGYSDWRLPTREEMLSIVNFETTTSTTKIDSNYFPEALPSWYWTASSNEEKPEYAWYVLFRNGLTLNDRKERPKHIRLVRTDKEA